MTQIEGSSASAETRDLVAKALEAMGGLLAFISKIDESQMQELRLREVALP